METLWHLLRLILGLAMLGGLVAWGLRCWWRRSEDRPGLAVKWGVTLLVLVFLGGLVLPEIRSEPGGEMAAMGTAIFGAVALAVSGLVLAIIWTPNITEWFGRKVGQLYDGGDLPADPEPFFSIAEARRKQGKPAEAVEELVRQLDRFPTHFRGLMLLADIQARDLHDLDAARLTLGRLINQPGHTPRNITFALTQLADWELSEAKDPAAAQAAFEQIIERFPETPEAYHAHQRIARLASPEFIAARAAPRAINLPRSEERLGLRADFTGMKAPPVPDPEARIAELVERLNAYPNDDHTREELVLAYANTLGRTDLAGEQLEQLIAQPNAPASRVARWLNLLADFQLRERRDPAIVRQTLQRIIARFPENALAEAARRRLATLGRETRAKEESQTVPLGPPVDPHLGLKTKR